MIVYDDDGFGMDTTKRVYCRYEKGTDECPDDCDTCPVNEKREFVRSIKTVNHELWTSIRWANSELEVYPEDPDIYFYKGKAYFDNWYYREALENFEHAINIDPRFGQALFYKARALANIKRFDEALATLDYIGTMYSSVKAIALKDKILNVTNTQVDEADKVDGSIEDRICKLIEIKSTEYMRQRHLYESFCTDRGRYVFAYKLAYSNAVIEKYGNSNVDEYIAFNDLAELIRYSFYLIGARLLTELWYDYYFKDNLISSVRRLFPAHGIKVSMFESLIEEYCSLLKSVIGSTEITEKILNTAICYSGIVAGSYIVPFSALQGAMLRSFQENHLNTYEMTFEETLDYVAEIINHGCEERLQRFRTSFISETYNKSYDETNLIPHIKYLRLYCPDIYAYKATIKDVPENIDNKHTQASMSCKSAASGWGRIETGTRCLALYDKKLESLISLLFPPLVRDTGDAKRTSYYYETSNKGYSVSIDGFDGQQRCQENDYYTTIFSREPIIRVVY